MNTNELLAATVILFGDESQKAMAIEECSELINALCKEKRGRVTDKDIITEIADVQIMCNQLALIYGKDEVRYEKSRKERRLFSRLQEQGLIPEGESLKHPTRRLAPEELTSQQLISEIHLLRHRLEKLTKEIKRREDDIERHTDPQTGNYDKQL